MYLIAGLGNPGGQYEYNRHNIGFMVMDALAEKKSLNYRTSKFQGFICNTDMNGEKIYLLKPMTYMNLSGNSICTMARYYHIDVEATIVIHDDVDLPLGTVKLKKGGGAGGHNGLKSIIENFSNNRDFYRLRLGVGPKDNKILSDFVLSDFPPSSREEVLGMIKKAVKALQQVIRSGPVKAMNSINRSIKPNKKKIELDETQIDKKIEIENKN